MTSCVALLRGVNVGGKNRLPMQELPGVLLLSVDAYRSILAQNPFPGAVGEPKSIHIGFLTGKPSRPDLSALQNMKSSSESFQLLEGAFWLHAPEGIGRSKLAANIDKCLGVATTGRNWRSARAVEELAAKIIS